MDWESAENNLRYFISEYANIGVSGQFALKFTLLPLLDRLNNGERSQELYDQIMACQ